MKKLLLTLSALAILSLPKVSAQLINANFATWTDDALNPAAKDPNSGNGSNGWWDFNLFSYPLAGKSPITVSPDSVNPTPYGGAKYCVRIVSAKMTDTSYNYLTSYGFNYPQKNGILFTGFVSAPNTFKKGIPCSNPIKTFSFYYRYIPWGGNGGDTCSCTVVLFHHDSKANVQRIIAAGEWYSNQTASSWTLATVHLNYDSLTSPVDTLFILFSACSLKSNPKSGDTLDIDGTVVNVGIDNLVEKRDNVNLYPNPANNEVNFAVTGLYNAARIDIYDITGKTVGSYSMHGNLLTLNTQSFENGLYLYKLYDENGEQLNVGKFSVVK